MIDPNLHVLRLTISRTANAARFIALLLALMLGCGGGSGTSPIDGAVTDASDASDAGNGDAGGSDAGDAGSDGSAICGTDNDCDDGLFCNGAERCLPGDAGADALGCVGADAEQCAVDETCDEDMDACLTECDLHADLDGDGFDRISCGGTDCDDTEAAVNPDALEVCDGGIDNDCNGLADAADGVCVPCSAGYRGFGESCTNIDECTEGAPCGGAAGATCTDTPGSYVCTCPSGYTSPASGGTCFDVDECTTGAPCGSAAGATCTNRPGSYACTCPSGYTSPASGGTCFDVDECATPSTCGGARAGCANTPGSYACSCSTGYAAPASGGTCGDIDECALSTSCPAMTCVNTAGSYICT